MKPNRPRVVTSSRNHITVGWDTCDFLLLKKKEGVDEEAREVKDEKRRWYVLERKHRVLGWCKAYMGFKTQSEVGPLAPGDFYQFRLKAATKNEESEWSDTLFAATRDDVISVAQLHRAVDNGPVTTLRKILGQRLSIADVPNKQGQTALGLAIAKNNLSFMGILLNHGADVGNVETGSGRTPLMTAAHRGRLEPVQLLLEKGSSWHTKDRNGLTALNYAVDNSHLLIVRLAIEDGGADVKSKDRFGWTPLMRGVLLKSSLEVLDYLLDNGSDADEADERGQSVLMQAVLSGRPEVVELLIQKGADITTKNIYGHSAFDMAKSSTNEGILKVARLLGDETEEETLKRERKRKKTLGMVVGQCQIEELSPPIHLTPSHLHS